MKNQDFNKGLKAYIAGDYSSAFEEWKPIAIKGEPNEKYDIGHLSYDGDVDPKVFAEAIEWYQLVAEEGDAQLA